MAETSEFRVIKYLLRNGIFSKLVQDCLGKNILRNRNIYTSLLVVIRRRRTEERGEI